MCVHQLCVVLAPHRGPGRPRPRPRAVRTPRAPSPPGQSGFHAHMHDWGANLGAPQAVTLCGSQTSALPDKGLCRVHDNGSGGAEYGPQPRPCMAPDMPQVRQTPQVPTVPDEGRCRGRDNGSGGAANGPQPRPCLAPRTPQVRRPAPSPKPAKTKDWQIGKGCHQCRQGGTD